MYNVYVYHDIMRKIFKSCLQFNHVAKESGEILGFLVLGNCNSSRQTVRQIVNILRGPRTRTTLRETLTNL